MSALSNMGSWNQASCDSKKQLFCKLDVLVHCLARTCRSLNYPHRHIYVIVLHVFVAATVKLQEFVMKSPDISPTEQDSKWAPVETSMSVPVTHYDVSVMSRLAKNI